MNKLSTILFTLITAIIIALILALTLLSKRVTKGQESFKYATFSHYDANLLYRILWPVDFDSTQKYPVVLFLHGAKDEVVPPIHSREIVAAIKKMGIDIKFSLYPEAGHNSWDNAFAEPNLLPWLFSN